MGSRKKAARAGLVEFGVTAAKRILDKETVRSTIRGQVRKLLTGSREKPYQIIDEVERVSERIVKLIEGRIPERACIGVDGIAGSGKSTLGRSLAKKLDLNWRTLYGREMGSPVELEPGTIYENIRLFRTQDIDRFDTIVYLDVPVAEAKKRVLTRDRNGTLVDLLDFDKLKRIGDLAFEIASGEEVVIADSAAKLKLRPAKGFEARANLVRRLAGKGLVTDGMSFEELLFAACYGEPQGGIRPYVRLGAFNQDLLAGIYSGLLVAFDVLS